MVRVIGCLFLLLSLNPSTSETGVSIESISEESLDIHTELAPDVYDQGQLLKVKKTKLRGRDYRLNTSGREEGVYIVRISYNSELLTGKRAMKE
ncbi:hypothetical protein [Gaoshiqia sp. Z1-71]|uniref:hypothetical protein n=1 Tax=Gaoshiqia hydrogeniformans TaxID=3290090 RepID=UPI003BF81C0A